MFKFVTDNVGGAGTKRKLTRGPCESCKRRHKRCFHADQSERETCRAASPGCLPSDIPKERSTVGSSRPQSDTDTNNAASSPSSTEVSTWASRPPPLGLGSRSQTSNAHVRFVANLSPESTFIINNHRLEGSDSISRHGVGLWLGQDDEVAVEAASANDQRVLSVPTQVLDGLSGQTLLLSILRPALRRECLSVIPPNQELGLLFDLYYAKIDVIFPLLKDEPWGKHGTVETITLKQCICLVASSDPAMRPHLRLPHHDGVHSQLDFRARIFAAVKQTLDLGFIADKIVLLQVCALMSMYTNDEDFGVLSTHYCAQAILYEQTLGFHVGWPDGKAGGERSRRIFWCVWVLDRLNAATNGRPTVMHRSDADKKVMDSIADQPPPFKLLIHIAQLLEDTVSLYRPGSMASAQKNNPRTFEELIEMASAQSLSGSLLASLELFYLSAVILQDRSSENQSSSELQGFYAMRIVATASAQNISSLIYWPVLPYAVTVAASVAYRSLRRSATAYSRRRAFTLFQDACKILDDLGKTFLSARAMARLTRDMMQGVGRATERIRRDSIKALNNAEDPTAEAIVDESTQESRDANQTQSSQVSRAPQPLRAAPAAEAAVYAQLGTDLFSGFTGDAEIFDNFDPSFDLGRADAIFAANLDLNIPYFADDWPVSGQYTRDVG